MRITKSDIGDFVAFTYSKLKEEERIEKIRQVEKDFSQFCGEEEIVYLSRAKGGKLNGVLFCVKMQEGVYGAANTKINPEASDSAVFEKLLTSCLQDLKGVARRYLARLISGPNEAGRREALLKMGFQPGPERKEFRQKLEHLPGDEGSPILWEPLKDISDGSLQEAAKILKAAGEGDPDFHPDDDAFELLKGYLKERGLSSWPHCIHIGSIGGKIAAIVVAQVEAATGWSRITYMGLLPEYRGRGLGVWVHRHGFTMMKDQNGKLYHGGTLAKNAGMIRLFEKHGCKPYRSMQEWELAF